MTEEKKSDFNRDIKAGKRVVKLCGFCLLNGFRAKKGVALLEVSTKEECDFGSKTIVEMGILIDHIPRRHKESPKGGSV